MIARDNGIGKVNWLRLDRLCDKYDFTVFAARFDNPRPDRIRWVRVWCFPRPVFLTTLSYRLSATTARLWHRVVEGQKFEIVQSSDAAVGGIDIADAHFCNLHYLRTIIGEVRFTQPREVAGVIGRVLGSVFGTAYLPKDARRCCSCRTVFDAN